MFFGFSHSFIKMNAGKTNAPAFRVWQNKRNFQSNRLLFSFFAIRIPKDTHFKHPPEAIGLARLKVSL
jgi:hypothetical protein